MKTHNTNTNSQTLTESRIQYNHERSFYPLRPRWKREFLKSSFATTVLADGARAIDSCFSDNVARKPQPHNLRRRRTPAVASSLLSRRQHSSDADSLPGRDATTKVAMSTSQYFKARESTSRPQIIKAKEIIYTNIKLLIKMYLIYSASNVIFWK